MALEYTRRSSVLDSVPSSGQILFHDDFSGPLKLVPALEAGDSIFELDPSIAFAGRQSLHMKTRTTGAASGDKLVATTLSYMLVPKLLSTFIRFRTPSFFPFQQIRIQITFQSQAFQFTAFMMFTPGFPAITVTSENNEVILDNSNDSFAVDAWHRIQFSVDFQELALRTLLFDHVEYDLSAFQVKASSFAGDFFVSTQLTIEAAGPVPCEIFLDEYLLTGF